MATKRFNDPIEPMMLGNMRANGTRSLAISGSATARRSSAPRPGWTTCEIRELRKWTKKNFGRCQDNIRLKH